MRNVKGVRNAECEGSAEFGMRNAELRVPGSCLVAGNAARPGPCHSAFRTPHSAFWRGRGRVTDLPYRVEKPWGHELIWARTDRYVGKILHIEPGHVLSLQYH